MWLLPVMSAIDLDQKQLAHKLYDVHCVVLINCVSIQDHYWFVGSDIILIRYIFFTQIEPSILFVIRFHACRMFGWRSHILHFHGDLSHE